MRPGSRVPQASHRQTPTGHRPSARRTFQPTGADVRAARELVAQALSTAGYRGDHTQVLLLASEVATNAVRHANTAFELSVSADPTTVRVAVVDARADRWPEVRQPGPHDSSGRGLPIIDELAAAWGWPPSTRPTRWCGSPAPAAPARLAPRPRH